jgi:hypothetical protein
MRLTAALVTIALAAPVAGARDFAQPPAADRVAAVGPGKRAPVEPAPVDRAALTRALAARRDHNLAVFRAYRKAGTYAHNFVRTGPLNVWLDVEGHLCAAANMIDKDGQHDLVMKTAAASNQIRLLDVTDGPLLDWILTSGLTLEEIDRIQMPQDMERLNGAGRAPARWRIAEDARLRKGYAAADAWLVAHRRAGLADAVDRLMEHPALAAGLLATSATS